MTSKLATLRAWRRPYKDFEIPIHQITEGGCTRDIERVRQAYANVDVANHYFKEDLAIPWLNRILRM